MNKSKVSIKAHSQTYHLFTWFTYLLAPPHSIQHHSHQREKSST